MPEAAVGYPFAEAFPPGEILRDEMEARGWTQITLAEILGRPVQAVNEILSAKKTITPETALGLAAAFGTSADFWLRLENSYRLSRAGVRSQEVTLRSRLNSLVPVRELRKRGWLPATGDLDALAASVCDFLEISSVSDNPRVDLRARKSDGYRAFSPGQIAWYFRARNLARLRRARPFDAKALSGALGGLARMSVDPESTRRLPSRLADLGVRLVYVEPLPQSKIDGAAFWLRRDSPVVAISLRFNRVDHGWFTLMHELAHIEAGDARGGYLDEDLLAREEGADGSKPEVERSADRRASEWLIPQARLQAFVRRTAPHFSTRRILDFASEVGVNPAIVVGQLQHRGQIPYTHSRSLLVPIRHLFASAG